MVLEVDTVARGVRMELDYYNEAANAEEFALRHAFLPFVTSPGWIPELMGPRGSSRVTWTELKQNRFPNRFQAFRWIFHGFTFKNAPKREGRDVNLDVFELDLGPGTQVLALNWYPSRAPKELSLEERRLLAPRS